MKNSPEPRLPRKCAIIFCYLSRYIDLYKPLIESFLTISLDIALGILKFISSLCRKFQQIYKHVQQLPFFGFLPVFLVNCQDDFVCLHFSFVCGFSFFFIRVCTPIIFAEYHGIVKRLDGMAIGGRLIHDLILLI